MSDERRASAECRVPSADDRGLRGVRYQPPTPRTGLGVGRHLAILRQPHGPSPLVATDPARSRRPGTGKTAFSATQVAWTPRVVAMKADASSGCRTGEGCLRRVPHRGCCTADARRATLDARRPTPDDGRPTTDARRLTPERRRATPDSRRPTSDGRRPTPDARRRTAAPRSPTPDDGRPTRPTTPVAVSPHYAKPSRTSGPSCEARGPDVRGGLVSPEGMPARTSCPSCEARGPDVRVGMTGGHYPPPRSGRGSSAPAVPRAGRWPLRRASRLGSSGRWPLRPARRRSSSDE